MKKLIVFILAVLMANMLIAGIIGITTASPGTEVSQSPQLVQDSQIVPGALTVNSYPSTNAYTATVTNPTYAYDKNMLTYTQISPPGTTATYYDVYTFNSSTTKDYVCLDIKMNYSVTVWRATYKISVYVGTASTALVLTSSTNQTTPLLRTWNAVIEPNDGLWNQTDINNMRIRIEVRKTLTSGIGTFKLYEAWASMPGDSFTVKINATDVSPTAALYTWEINLTFNPAILQAVTAREGPFLKQAGNTFLTGPTINNNIGWILVGAALQSYDLGGASGSGLLATIAFKTIAKGNCDLNFSQTKLRTWDGVTLVPITHTNKGGWFESLPGDANRDGIVDVFDILKVKYHRSGPPPGPGGYNLYADINKDGSIDVFDILITKAHLGETV